METYPHLSPLYFPFVSVSFVAAPFCLEKVQDAGEGEVLRIRHLHGWRRRGYCVLLLLLLLTRLALLTLLWLLLLEMR